jgi:hypothetical protein
MHETPHYKSCLACRATNPAHRVACYRCGRTLTMTGGGTVARQPDSFAPTLVAPIRDTRRLPRKRVLITGAMVEGAGFMRHTVTIVNLTPIGLQIQTAIRIPTGGPVHLRFRYAGTDFDATGTVRYTREMPRGMPPGPAIYAAGMELSEPLRDLPGDVRPHAPVDAEAPAVNSSFDRMPPL